MQPDRNGSAEGDFVGGNGRQAAENNLRTQQDPVPGRNGRNSVAICARVISAVFQPLLLPLYALLIIFNANSFVAVMVPLRAKLLIVSAVALFTLILPGVIIGVFNALGALEDFRMNRRRERVVPLAIILVSYVSCAYMVLAWTKIDLVFMALMAAVSCIVLALIVTSFWKISLHMTGMGGIYALLFVLGIAEPRDFTWAMALATLVAGLVAASRLYLGRHTPAQVAAGFVGGFVVSMLTLMLI
jgi:membrane-associated phospholipid phosphatase